MMRKIIILIFLLSSCVETKVLIDKLILKEPFGEITKLSLTALISISLLCLISLLLYHKKRRLIDNLWTAGLSTLLVFFVSDIALGTFYAYRASPTIIKDPLVHHKLRANTQSVYKSFDFEIVQNTNSLSLRGREIRIGNSNDAFRIVMLGDSFTMGKGVNDDETFSAILEKNLSHRSTRNIEVINAGVDSYSPILSYFQLKHTLLPLGPDLVVLNLDHSDVSQDKLYRRMMVKDSEGNLLGVDGYSRLTATAKLRHWIDAHLFFSRLVLDILDKRFDLQVPSVRTLIELPNREWIAHTLDNDTMQANPWLEVFDSILLIKKLCDTRHIPFAMTIYPWGHQVNEFEWVPGREKLISKQDRTSDKNIQILEELARSHGIPLLNTYPAFRSYEYRGAERLYFSHDMHWTSYGHRVMAEELEAFIRTKFLPHNLEHHGSA